MNLSLAVLFVRSRAARRAALPLFVSAFLAWTVLHVLVAVQLDPYQRVQDYLGSADGVTQVPQQVVVGSDITDPGRPAGVDDVVTVINASPSWAGVDLRVPFVEHAAPSVASDGRIELIAGRWPSSPGEIALTPAAQQVFERDAPRPVLGELALTVVGTVRQTYATGATSILAAPGTWNSWVVDPRDAELAQEFGQISLYWNAVDPGHAANSYAQIYGEAGADGSASIQTRGGLRTALSELGIGQLSRMLLAYGVPVAVVLMVGGWFAGVLGARVGARILRPLGDVGVPARMLSRTLLGTLSAVAAALLAAGALGSYIMILAIRPVLAAGLDHPVRPWEWSGAALLITAALGLLMSTVGGAVGLRRARPRSARGGFTLTSRSERVLRVVAAGAAVLGLVAAGTGTAAYSTLAIVIICVGVAIGSMAPAIMRVILRLRVAPSPTLAALRFTSSRLASLGAYTALVVLLVSVAASTLAVVGSMTAVLNATNSRLAPAGTAFTSGALGQPPPVELVERFERDIGVSRPVTVWESIDFSTEDAVVTWSFASVGDMAEVLGPLDDRVSAALVRGPVPTTIGDAGEDGAPTSVVPDEFDYVAYLDLQHRRPSEPEITVRQFYTGLTPEQDAAASTWDIRNGISAGFARAHTEPEPFSIPTGTQLSAGGFGLVIAMISYFLLQAETTTYRPLLAGLNAVGLGRGWLLRMLGVVGAVVGFTCAVAGLTAVLANLTLSSWLLPGSVSVAHAPWIAVAAMLAASVLGAIGGAVLAAGHLHARERRV